MAWETVRGAFQAKSESPINVRLSELQSAHLEKGDHTVECLNKIMGLVGELESAGHFVW